MPDNDHAPPLSRAISTDDIPAEGLPGRIEASADERAAIAEALDLAALDDLVLDYTLTPAGRGRFRLTGHWHAAATQTCGVTLEPIEHALGESIDLAFWPPEVWERHVRDNGGVTIVPDEETPEIIEDGTIDPGHLLEELLIVALPPFPRQDNAGLEWHESVPTPESPFAVLKDLPTRNRGGT